MKVRFKEKYCADINNRISYELVSDEVTFEYIELEGKYCESYNTKVLGFVPASKMEITNDPTDIDAVDIAIVLSNMYNHH